MVKRNHFYDIKKQIRFDYANCKQRVAGILIVRPNTPESVNILRDMAYYNQRSGNLFNFYVPGFDPSKEWSGVEDDIYREFNGKTEAEFIEDFEYELKNYEYAGGCELILFNVTDGELQNSPRIVLRLDEIEFVENYSKLFEYLYHNIEELTSVLDGKIALGKDVLRKSLVDSLQAALRKVPFVKNVVKNSRGIYFQ